jgi:hypothetical protein
MKACVYIRLLAGILAGGLAQVYNRGFGRSRNSTSVFRLQQAVRLNFIGFNVVVMYALFSCVGGLCMWSRLHSKALQELQALAT